MLFPLMCKSVKIKSLYNFNFSNVIEENCHWIVKIEWTKSFGWANQWNFISVKFSHFTVSLCCLHLTEKLKYMSQRYTAWLFNVYTRVIEWLSGWAHKECYLCASHWSITVILFHYLQKLHQSFHAHLIYNSG